MSVICAEVLEGKFLSKTLLYFMNMLQSTLPSFYNEFMCFGKNFATLFNERFYNCKTSSCHHIQLLAGVIEV